MESLGQKIRQRRLEKKLTQVQLAEGIVSASAISQIESDKINPTYKLLCQIAVRLDVSLDYFLSTATSSFLEHSSAHTLAKAFLEAKDYEQALPILEQQVALYEEDPNLLKDLISCYLHMKNFRQSNELLEKLLKIALKDEDHNMYVWSLNELGKLFYKQNKKAISLHYWQQAYDFLQHLKVVDPFLKTNIMRNLALVNHELGNYDASVKLFRESQELLRPNANMKTLAANYLGLGASLFGKKEYQLAEDYFQRAIIIYKSLNQIHASIQAKENFGIIRGENGEHQDALKTLEECLREYKEHGFLQQTANTHGEIAKILIRLNHLEEAEKHIAQAFHMCDPETPYEAQSYYVRSLLHKAHARFPEAVADAIRAKDIYKLTESLQEYNKSSLYLSNLYKDVEDYKSSTEVLEESQTFIQNYLRENGVIL